MERFSVYVQRVQLYFLTNDIKDERHVVTFLSLLGRRSYSLLGDLLTPELPHTKTWDELVSTLKNHYEPIPSVIARRFHFYKRNQQSGET